MPVAAAADEYYIYSKYDPLGVGILTSAGGYIEYQGIPDVWGDEIQYVYFLSERTGYKVRVKTIDGDGKIDPRQHPSHYISEFQAPIEPRQFEIVSSKNLAGYASGHTEEFHIDSSGVYLGAYPNGIHKWDHNWNYIGKIANKPSSQTETLAYNSGENVWYTGGRYRTIYELSDLDNDGNFLDETWKAIFTHPSYGGGHHDGMEYVGGYLWISDMTSDVIGKWWYNSTSLIWEELDRYSYTESAYVEGMGFGPNDHFWVTGSTSYMYELGNEITKGYPIANAGDDIDNYPPTIPIKFDGSASHHTDPTKNIVSYEWDFDGDGNTDSTDIMPEYTYPAFYNPDGSIDWDKTTKDYTITLKVSDNSNPALTNIDTTIVHITAPPWDPIAIANPMLIIPYIGYVGELVQLDGSLSFDPEELFCLVASHPWCEMGISKYEWDLDNDGNFDDSTIAKPTWTWNTEGIYNIGLIVTDSQPSGPGGTFGEKDISDKSYATVVIKMQEPLLIINGPRLNMTKDKSLIIKWETNRPSNSLIRYGISPSSYEYESNDSYLNDDVTEHEVILKNIEYGQTYYYVLFSDDKSGNPVESKEYNFKFIASSSVDGYNFSNWGLKDEELTQWFDAINPLDEHVSLMNVNPIYNFYQVFARLLTQWGGHCWGMTSTSILYFENEIDKPDGYEQSNTFSIPKDAAQEDINYYQPTQMVPKYVDHYFTPISNFNGHEEFVNIVNSINKNKPLLMQLYTDNKVAHAVTPIGYSTRENSGIIYIYDNNMLGETHEIEVNQNSINYLNNPSYQEDDITFVEFDSFEPEKEFKASDFKLSLQILSNSLKGKLGEIKSYIISLKCPADLRIVDQYGRVITTLNGETNEIPDAFLNSGDEFEIYTLPSNLEYTVELVGTGDGNADLSFASKDIILTFDDIPITSLTRGKMYIGRTNSYILSLDNNNDGIIDEYITPMIDTYTENGYNITFLPPITTRDQFNLKDGSTLPIKFTARDRTTDEFVYDDTVNVTITNSTGHLITYFTNGTGTDSVRINTEEEQYIVNFHSKNYDLNVGETYAITVTFGESDSLTGYDVTYFNLVEGGKVKGKAKV